MQQAATPSANKMLNSIVARKLSAELMKKFSEKLDELIGQARSKNKTTENVEDKAKNAVTLAAWAHQKFVELHPFFGGNGRVARVFFDYVFQRITAGENIPAYLHRFIPLDATDGGMPVKYHEHIGTVQEQTYKTDKSLDSHERRQQSKDILHEEFGKVALEEILGNDNYKNWNNLLLNPIGPTHASDRFDNPRILSVIIDHTAERLHISLGDAHKTAIIKAIIDTGSTLVDFILTTPDQTSIVSYLMGARKQSPQIPEYILSEWNIFLSHYHIPSIS